jgi:hypothetical protein
LDDKYEQALGPARAKKGVCQTGERFGKRQYKFAKQASPQIL